MLRPIRLAALLLALDERELVFRRGLGEIVVDARLGLTVKPKAIHELTRRRRPLV
mgnify:CR=1 FL=1